VPAAQLVQVVEVEIKRYLPAEQLAQVADDDAPVYAEEEPVGQLVHALDAAVAW
jgi:hypothetical protein